MAQAISPERAACSARSDGRATAACVCSSSAINRARSELLLVGVVSKGWMIVAPMVCVAAIVPLAFRVTVSTLGLPAVIAVTVIFSRSIWIVSPTVKIASLATGTGVVAGVISEKRVVSGVMTVATGGFLPGKSEGWPFSSTLLALTVDGTGNVTTLLGERHQGAKGGAVVGTPFTVTRFWGTQAGKVMLLPLGKVTDMVSPSLAFRPPVVDVLKEMVEETGASRVAVLGVTDSPVYDPLPCDHNR